MSAQSPDSTGDSRDNPPVKGVGERVVEAPWLPVELAVARLVAWELPRQCRVEVVGADG